jgi:hypothetical protein
MKYGGDRNVIIQAYLRSKAEWTKFKSIQKKKLKIGSLFSFFYYRSSDCFASLNIFTVFFCTVCLCSVQITREERYNNWVWTCFVYYRCRLKMETGSGCGGGFCVKLCN